jgi:hypothetical protein
LDKDSQRVVEVAEHVADGIASPEELRTPCQAVFNHINDDWFSLQRGARAAIEAANVISTISITSAIGCADFAADASRFADAAVQCSLLRDVLGNPFRPLALDQTLITGNVTALAESIYADRAFERLPILADALEDAGCDNADILNHCRQPSSTEHVRGCWVVDLVLGKS